MARSAGLQELRPAIFALRAFNVETGLVAETAKEPALAQLRLTWWRDAVAGMHKHTEHNHPVIHALAAVSRSLARTACSLSVCDMSCLLASALQHGALRAVPLCAGPCSVLLSSPAQ